MEEDEDPSRLLLLPLELQKMIYKHYLEEFGTAYLVEKGRIVSSSTLHLSCRQLDQGLSTSFSEKALPAGNTIIGRVCDFDFKPLIAALNWLKKSSIKADQKDASNRPALVVQLSISKACCEHPSFADSLPKWCKWVRKNSNAGMGITIDYQIEGAEDMDQAFEAVRFFAVSQFSESSSDLVIMFRSLKDWYVGVEEQAGQDLERRDEERERELQKHRVPDPSMIRNIAPKLFGAMALTP